MKNCQLANVVAETNDIHVIALLVKRIRKFVGKTLKKRLGFLKTVIGRILGSIPKQMQEEAGVSILKPGDTVRVKTRDDIFKTLDNKNKCGQVTFDDGMWEYCSTEQKVLKVVHQFMDEGKWVMRKAKKCVLLENTFCKGDSAIGKCDRSCPFFWRKEWLVKSD